MKEGGSKVGSRLTALEVRRVGREGRGVDRGVGRGLTIGDDGSETAIGVGLPTLPPICPPPPPVGSNVNPSKGRPISPREYKLLAR